MEAPFFALLAAQKGTWHNRSETRHENKTETYTSRSPLSPQLSISFPITVYIPENPKCFGKTPAEIVGMKKIFLDIFVSMMLWADND